MKKLMIAAALAVVAGGAFAANVFDYKASVKYVDFKQVKIDGTKEWVKTVKSTTLKGYLVTPLNCACEVCGAEGREPGFLVLTSSLAKKYNKNRLVKLMPANLLVDAWSQKALTKSSSLLAQGYLFAGLGKNDYPAPAGSPVYGFGDLNTTEATKYLFGQANIEDDDGEGNVNFIEPFLDAAGFGKATFDEAGEDPICGHGGPASYCLKNLSGSVIGGSWSCLANSSEAYEEFLCQGWENAAISHADGTDYTGYDKKYNVVSGTWSIKANSKIKPAGLTGIDLASLTGATGSASQGVLEYVKACGLKLQSSFELYSFDDNGAFPGAFLNKWFAAPTVD